MKNSKNHHSRTKILLQPTSISQLPFFPWLIISKCLQQRLCPVFQVNNAHLPPFTASHTLGVLHVLHFRYFLTALTTVFVTWLFVSMKNWRTHTYLQDAAGCIMLPFMDIKRHTSPDNMDVSEKIFLVLAFHHGFNQLLQTRRRALELLAKLSC